MNRIVAIIITLLACTSIVSAETLSQTDMLTADEGWQMVIPEGDDGPVVLSTDRWQEERLLTDTIAPALEDSIEVDSAEWINFDDDMRLMADTFTMEKPRRNWNTWRPNAKRAMWLAIVIPGAGQIYNRKFWKLPIIYGGFMGCLYALRWNNMMYKDYSQGYIDITDGNPETHSYDQFMHFGQTITEPNKRYEDLFRKRKDYYRRYRDLSLFILIGVYALSVIDAYVDASLSEFDISDDLSLRVAPAVINNGSRSNNLLHSSALGLQCSLRF